MESEVAQWLRRAGLRLRRPDDSLRAHAALHLARPAAPAAGGGGERSPRCSTASATRTATTRCCRRSSGCRRARTPSCGSTRAFRSPSACPGSTPSCTTTTSSSSSSTPTRRPAWRGPTCSTRRCGRRSPSPASATSSTPATRRCCPRSSITLLDAYRAARERNGDLPETPRLAVVDVAGTPTVAEFRLICRLAEQSGLDTVVATLDDVSYDGSRLMVQGEPVQLVYRRALVESLTEDSPLALAARDRRAVVVNPFRVHVTATRRSSPSSRTSASSTC